MRLEDLSGRTFGRLTVLNQAPSKTTPGGTVKTRWNTRCSCGSIKEVQAAKLRSGHTLSCGCLRVEVSKGSGEWVTTHGHSRAGSVSPTYRSWRAMVGRCTNNRHKDYPRYGKLGVTVDPRWLDFPSFLADMGERPPGTTLDRYPDGGGGYKPGNCRWATPKQQSRNLKSNVYLTFQGESRLVIEWAEVFGVPYNTLHRRLSAGWGAEKALSTPLRVVKSKGREASSE